MVPFFTTREEEGTGLGLPLCKEIVDQHHGRISYDETAPRTTFVIKLPLRQPASR
jgi:signal transduction histidine kinase